MKAWLECDEVFTSVRRSLRAFTLIEVMLAIMIFSMVLVAIYSSWHAIIRSSRAGQKAAAEAQRTRVALRALEESLGSTVMFLQNMPYYSFQTGIIDDFGAISFVSHLPPSFPGSGLFGDQVTRRITFSVKEEKGQNLLLLQQTPLLEPEETAETPYTITLGSNVREFRFSFFDTNTMEWAEEWPWTNRLPKMVRAQMAFADRTRPLSPRDMVTRTIYLSSVAIPREAQVPILRRTGGRLPGGVTPQPGASSTIPRPSSPGLPARRAIRSPSGRNSSR